MEFVTLVSRTGDPVPRSALESLTSTHPRGSLIQAAEAAVRSEHDGRRLTLVRTTAGGELLRAAGGWGGFDGIGVVSAPAGPTTGVAGLVADVLEARGEAADLARLAGRVRGNFVIWASLPDGSFVAVPDPLGTYPVFVATLPACHAVTNNALLLEAALAATGQPVRRSPAGQGMEAVFGTMAFEHTGYEEVRLVPAGHLVRLTADGTLSLPVLAAFEKLYTSSEDVDTLLDRAAQTIVDNVRALAAAPSATRIADLTGGFDSRIVLAALLAAGIEGHFGFSCYGARPGPDYSTSTYLREVYGLADGRDRLPPSVFALLADPVRAMGHVLFRTMGCYSSYLALGVGRPREAGLLQLAGGLAGTFRAVYSGRLTGHGPAAAAARILRSRRWAQRRPLLNPGFTDGLEVALLTSFGSGARGDGCATAAGTAAALDQWYVGNRNRYHFGVSWRATQLQYTMFHPLYSLAAVSAAYVMPAGERAANRVGFEIMRRLYEPLTTLPFAEKKWDASLTDPLPDAALFRGVEPFTPTSPVVELRPGHGASPDPVAPYQVGQAAGEPSPWQRAQLRIGAPSWLVSFDMVLPAARDYVRSLAPSSRVWEVFDRGQSLQLLDRPLGPDWTGPTVMIAYKLLAAGVWLSHDEVSSAAGRSLDAPGS